MDDDPVLDTGIYMYMYVYVGYIPRCRHYMIYMIKAVRRARGSCKSCSDQTKVM